MLALRLRLKIFYNVPTRRKALRSVSEEHQKITDIVSRYAIHNASVGFTLKKQGDSNSDVKTPPGSSQIDNIRTIYGPAVARELLDVSVDDVKLSIKLCGLVSNANYNVKRAVFLLFINNRLVDSCSLRKAIDVVYAAYLPKNTHPFVYISLEIAPQNVDVNVHPTKHEVHFLHEDAIIESVQKAIDSRLLGANNSRTYYLQTLKPIVNTSDDVVPASDNLQSKNLNSSGVVGRVYAQNLVRTDSREQKLDAFLVSSSGPRQLVRGPSGTTVDTPPSDPSLLPCSGLSQLEGDEETEEKVMEVTNDTEVGSGIDVSTLSAVESGEAGAGIGGLTEDGYQHREIKLTSVLQLRRDIESGIHIGLRSLIQNHSFVGCVNAQFSLIQHDTKLYLVDTAKLSKELFYQLVLFSFGNIGFLRLSEPAPIRELVMLALDLPDSGWTAEDGPKDELAQYVVDLLTAKADMLADYFSLQIDSAGNLLSLPLLLDKYVPSIEGLPMFILRLATEVEWDVEKQCFDTFARETAEFFALKAKWLSAALDDITDSNDKPSEHSPGVDVTSSWQWMLEHCIYPTARSSLIPPKRFADDGTILQIANMPDLYKVFERC